MRRRRREPAGEVGDAVAVEEVALAVVLRCTSASAAATRSTKAPRRFDANVAGP